MRRDALSDPQWARIAPLFRRRAKKGRTPSDRRTIANGIRWILPTGAPWRDLPERYGPWQTVFDRFNRLAPRRHLSPHRHFAAGRVGRQEADRPRPWCIDGTIVALWLIAIMERALKRLFPDKA